MKENEDGFDIRLADIDRIYELGFISWEERGLAVHDLLLQDISDELDRMIKRSQRHPRDFPLDK